MAITAAVLDYLRAHPGRMFNTREIADGADLPDRAVQRALAELVRLGAVTAWRGGNARQYSA